MTVRTVRRVRCGGREETNRWNAEAGARAGRNPAFENAASYGTISPAMASREFTEQCRRDEAEQRKRNVRDGILILLLILAVAGILAALGVKVDATKFVR